MLYISNQSNLTGGAQRSLYDLLRRINRGKIKPHFASTRDGELMEAIGHLGVPCLKLDAGRLSDPIPYIRSIFRLIRFIQENRISIIHNNQCIDANYTWIPGRICRVPLVNHLRDRNYYRLNRLVIRHVEINICISRWICGKLPHCRKTLIHNGIELEKFTDSGGPGPGGRRKITIGLIGRMVPHKGHEVFIQAAKTVHGRNQNVRFMLFGKTNNHAETAFIDRLKNLVRGSRLEKDLHFLDYSTDVSNAFRQIDISVVPSIGEPFGRVIIESMACFKPVIASGDGGAADIVTDRTGILVPAGDPGALAEAIQFLIDHPKIRLKMGKAGRNRVEDLFTIEKTLLKIYRLYDAVLSKNRIDQQGITEAHSNTLSGLSFN